MTSILYSYTEIISELDVADPEEKADLVKIIDDTFRHHVLDLILTHLPREHHEHFLDRFHTRPHDQELLDYLKSHIVDIEAKLTIHTGKIKKDILADIQKSKHR